MTELKLNEIKMTKKEYADDLKMMFDKGYAAGLENGRVDGIVLSQSDRLDGDVEEQMKEELRRDLVNEYNQEIIDKYRDTDEDVLRELED